VTQLHILPHTNSRFTLRVSTPKKWGGAQYRRHGLSTVDKIATNVASNFVTPAPSFSGAARVLAGQAYKG